MNPPTIAHPATRAPLALRLRHWGTLVACTILLSALFTVLHLPAGVLLGGMLVAIVMATREMRLQVPPLQFALAQGLIGCLMAHSLHPSVLNRVAHDWPLFLCITLLVLATSALLGFVLTRRQLLSGTTAIWGLAPGAASAMVIMAESYGADVRLVALMQYARVVLVTLLASLVAGLWVSHANVRPTVQWLAWDSTRNVALTLLLVAGCVFLARRIRLSAGAMLLPLLAGLTLNSLGWLTIELPPLLMALAYATLGWSVGLRFNRAILQHAWSALPAVLTAIFGLIALGLLLAVALSLLGGFDPLTAYLATSPGGADSVAVISASAAVDAGFVMAMQLARFSMVLLFGPRLFPWVAQRAVSALSPTPLP